MMPTRTVRSRSSSWKRRSPTYRHDVSAGLAILSTATDRLRVLADTGQLAQAKSAWLTAHLDYERLGAAYDTFGVLQRRDRRAAQRTPTRGERPGLDRLPPPGVRLVARSARGHGGPGGRRAGPGRPRPGGRLPRPDHRDQRSLPAHPRDPREHPAVPVDRRIRRGQPHRSGHGPGQRRRAPR